MTDEQNLADKIEWLDAVEVTQADEHAAEEAWRSIKAFLEGSAEEPGLVDAFARHRIAALRLAETSSASASPEAASALADRVGTSATLSRPVEKLEAENVRMREALEQIGDTKPVPSPGSVCAKIARAALGGSIDAKA